MSLGKNVKPVKRMRGLDSAAMTLDTFADLFGDDLDCISDAVDYAATVSLVGKVWADDHTGTLEAPNFGLNTGE